MQMNISFPLFCLIEKKYAKSGKIEMLRMRVDENGFPIFNSREKCIERIDNSFPSWFSFLNPV